MKTARTTPIVPRKASRPGALDGFECRCLSCGMVLRSSLRSLVEQDAREHADYHDRRAA